jgi:quinol monooxygenase YgiN
MSEVVLLVTQRVHPDRYEEAQRALGEMVQAVHAHDDGCLLYALHAVPGDRTRLVCVEKWASQDDLEAHAAQAHVTRLADVPALDGPPEVTVLAPLSCGDPAKGAL